MATKKPLSVTNKKLAALHPPYNKITRGDVIKGAQMKKGASKGSKKK